MPCIRTFNYLPSESKIEPDLRLRENLVEVNDKKGGRGEEGRKFCPAVYLTLRTTNKKHAKKQPALLE